MSIKRKFIVSAFTLVALLVFSMGSLMMVSERHLLVKETKQHQDQAIQLLARVCEEAVYQNDFVLFNYFEKLEKERGFLAAFFVDNNNIIQIHSNPKEIGKKREPGGDNVVDFAAPVTVSAGQAGTAHLHYSQSEIDAFLRQSLKQTLTRIGAISLVSLFIGLLGAWWLAVTMVTPIQRLVRGMKKMATGDLSPVAFPKRHDELGWMGTELNETIKKLKELDEMKRDFVSSVTHELKSPLMAIESFVSILMKRSQKKGWNEDQELLMTVKNNSARLRKMIEDLLTTAKIEAGRLDIQYQLFDIRKSIQEVIQLYTPLAQEKGVLLRQDIPVRPVHVWGDSNKMVHILTNLVSNALKFTEKGNVMVSIRETEAEIRISVADTGPGIPPLEREKIFEKFFQGTNGNLARRGTGLGLAIVKGLVESHGGSIRIDDNNGLGTQFTFTLSRKEKGEGISS